jgi:hypothetical protein
MKMAKKFTVGLLVRRWVQIDVTAGSREEAVAKVEQLEKDSDFTTKRGRTYEYLDGNSQVVQVSENSVLNKLDN